jgi:hypothetical protein
MVPPMPAVQNESAGAHWATVADDLKNAIVIRLGPLVSKDGQKLSIPKLVVTVIS